jgi:two-component system, sensor histidine kinase LadS
MWRQLIWFLLLCSLGSSAGAQPIEVDASSSSFEVSGHLSVSPLQAQFASPEDALAAYGSGQFEKLPAFMGRGMQKDAVWLAFDMHGARTLDESLVAQVGPAVLDHVAVWQADAAGRLTLIGSAGDQVPLNQVAVPGFKPSFALRLAGGARNTVLLRIQTTGPNTAIVKLYRAEHFPSAQATEGLLLGFALTAYLMMGVVALGLFWVLREKIYLLWLVMILAMASYAFMSTGMGYRYLHWDELSNVNKLTNAFLIAAFVTNLVFINLFFHFKSLHGWLHGLFVHWALLAPLVAVLGISLSLPALAALILSSLFLMMVIAIVGIALQMIRHHPESLRYGPLFALYLADVAASMLASNGIGLPLSEWTSSGAQVAAICNLLSLQVAMFSRAMDTRRKHAQERTRLLTQLTQQNQELEARVERRTESLSKALREVQQAEASQRQLLSMASHEFRTPAASIKASLDSLVILKDQIPAEIASRLANMRQASLRMIGLANDLINEDRLHELMLTPRSATLDLRQLTADVIERYSVHSGLRAVLPSGAVNIEGDVALLGIALHNLIDNALRHGQPGQAETQRITVTLQAQSDHVELQVTDNGPGIPDSLKQRVFDRYHAGAYRDSTDNDATMSTSSGLGLSIVQDIAQAHGGRAVVRDAYPHGAMLVLSLPA